jgi:hypothetical protein
MDIFKYFQGERRKLKFVTEALELLYDERHTLDTVIATLERLERRHFAQGARKRGRKSVPVAQPKRPKNQEP